MHNATMQRHNYYFIANRSGFKNYKILIIPLISLYIHYNNKYEAIISSKMIKVQ